VVQITVATPIPGSQLYDEAKAADSLLTNDWDRYDFTSPTMAGQLPAADMDAVLHRAYLASYLNRRFLLSLFSRRTNLHRLRRTALRVFFAWIRFLVSQRLVGLLRSAGSRAASALGMRGRKPDRTKAETT